MTTAWPRPFTSMRSTLPRSSKPPYAERLLRAEVELEVGGGKAGQQRGLAVEVGHEPALEAVRLGALRRP